MYCTELMFRKGKLGVLVTLPGREAIGDDEMFEFEGERGIEFRGTEREIDREIQMSISAGIFWVGSARFIKVSNFSFRKAVYIITNIF